MTVTSILSHIFSTRGTTLCLGLNNSVPLSIFGINEEIDGAKDKRAIIIPNSTGVPIQNHDIHICGESWTIHHLVSAKHFTRVIAVMPFDDIITSDKTAQHLIKMLNILNIQMIDSFPFQTMEGVKKIAIIKEICKEHELGYGVALHHGVNSYGSTDISTEKEAVEKAQQDWLDKGIDCMDIDRVLSPTQTLAFFSPQSRILANALNKFNEDCRATEENINLATAVLTSSLMPTPGMSLESYLKEIRSNLDNVWEPLLPVVKYLDDDFYNQFRDSIRSKFNSAKDSEAVSLSGYCVEVLSLMLKTWIAM
jgi:hypothetical protein